MLKFAIWMFAFLATHVMSVGPDAGPVAFVVCCFACLKFLHQAGRARACSRIQARTRGILARARARPGIFILETKLQSWKPILFWKPILNLEISAGVP